MPLPSDTSPRSCDTAEEEYSVTVILTGHEALNYQFIINVLTRPGVGWRVVMDDHAETLGIMSGEPLDLAMKVRRARPSPHPQVVTAAHLCPHALPRSRSRSRSRPRPRPRSRSPSRSRFRPRSRPRPRLQVRGVVLLDDVYI